MIDDGLPEAICVDFFTYYRTGTCSKILANPSAGTRRQVSAVSVPPSSAQTLTCSTLKDQLVEPHGAMRPWPGYPQGSLLSLHS